MNLRWADPMPEGGRVKGSEIDQRKGRALVSGLCTSCSQTLNITLFFDGTNNNDVETNPFRDSLRNTHTNVSRLHNAARDEQDKGIFKFYIPGVGTPFPEIGEEVYSTQGKSLAVGFGSRCVWGYTRVLSAIYWAIASDKTRRLIQDDDAPRICRAVSNGNPLPLARYIDRLGIAHKQAVDEGAWPRTVSQVWINAIGFSRGAASARVFVHKLVNEWARNGRIGYQSGKYALPYRVNFVGLFDTVASVGPPDSARVAVDIGLFDGHFSMASGGALDIPDAVRFCHHAFSVHEQRMSFPLDSIRNGPVYGKHIREEVAYPGVHSDVGGGYAPNEQGKGRTSQPRDDSHKLSQIPLHDMYRVALSCGVPLLGSDEIDRRDDLIADFALSPETVMAFNAWRETVPKASSVEEALKAGMEQMLAWRTLRARINTGDYITEQTFFDKAHEDRQTPHKVEQNLKEAMGKDPQTSALRMRLERIRADALTSGIGGYLSALGARQKELDELNTALAERRRVLCGEVAHPGMPPGAVSLRPGEGALEATTNDQTDLRQGAEDMRLLLGHLYPGQCEQWQVNRMQPPPVMVRGISHPQPAVLSVRRAQPGSDSPWVRLEVSGVLLNVAWSTLVQAYRAEDDVMAAPLPEVEGFLRQCTSVEAASRLPAAAVKLFDDYVHDSRCWFRVPYFHEYAPGGYGFPRVVFVGQDRRKAYLGLAETSAPLYVGNNEVQPGWSLNQAAVAVTL
ncbi:T6SS phospholipase effector Tle1-like catalytic domain-containing protein [Paraburkholderia hayleyella]|uniref:T6SS phospholipase effector Tle1-like catalytic domain-containing protein n=1 Tax=Paraburkholderia hayleyella TaxID=2152889 RepID=UPI0012923C98|nr:DUF2235 domain-containing protein [Paraburkholderia hayleyella]